MSRSQLLVLLISNLAISPPIRLTPALHNVHLHCPIRFTVPLSALGDIPSFDILVPVQFQWSAHLIYESLKLPSQMALITQMADIAVVSHVEL